MLNIGSTFKTIYSYFSPIINRVRSNPLYLLAAGIFIALAVTFTLVRRRMQDRKVEVLTQKQSSIPENPFKIPVKPNPPSPLEPKMEIDFKALLEELEKDTQAVLEGLSVLKYREDSCHFSNVPCPEKTFVGVQAGETYLHANTITLDDLQFVATQYPLTQELFWKFAQEKANLIVDLTNAKDFEKRPRLKAYVPHPNKEQYDGTGSAEYQVGALKVTYINEREMEGLEASNYLYEIDNGSTKTQLKRLHFRGWKDHEGVNVSSLQKLIKYVELYIKKDRVVVIHCRAGVGRTATLMISMYLKRLITLGEIKTQRELLEKMKETIIKVRQQRGPQAVQTEEQLQAIWEVSLSYLNQRRKIDQF